MEPRTCVVTAAFERYGRPISGTIRFTPQRLWIRKGQTWACLAPEMALDAAGSFVAEVTATDNDAIMWHYLISTPAGDFPVYVPWNERGWTLRELVDEHRAGARA
jgi:hypothetical protein